MANGRRKPSKNGVKGKCLTPGCKRKGSHSRGNCRQCYDYYRILVLAGKTTWDKLIRKGVTGRAYERRNNPKPAQLAAG